MDTPTPPSQARDERGHFIKKPSANTATTELPKTAPRPATPATHSIAAALAKQTEVKKTTDDNTLIDVHIGNPLRKITALLEEIKRQKAFSFTLRGSLGIMGVVLAFTTFGFFGTTHALCDKGVQSKIGTIKVLQSVDEENDNWFQNLLTLANSYKYTLYGMPVPQHDNSRVILVTKTLDTIHLLSTGDQPISQLKKHPVIVTGPYDSCSQTLKVVTSADIEQYQN